MYGPWVLKGRFTGVWAMGPEGETLTGVWAMGPERETYWCMGYGS